MNSINVSSAYPSITPSSPVVFTWTPPQSICGTPRSGFLYDLELRELLENQTVLDVTNNPFVFQKTRLPSTTFLLDTNLYRNVLQRGKRYAVRVKAYATAPLDTFAVDNEGYSRVEAFQFGNVPDAVVRPVGVFTIDQPENYYIPFGERKTNQWDDAYTALQRGAKRDTIIPIEEYIALNLIQNGIAYNPDAIELFLTLNPELASLKNLRLSTPARLPEFPPIGVDEEKRFAKEMATSLSPDPAANKTFRRYLDSLHSATLVLPGSNALAAGMATVVASLTDFEKRVDNTDRVSVTLLNQLLAEMVYTLRQSDGAGNPKDEDHLANVMQTMRDLLANESNSTSLLFPLPPGGAAPVTSLLPSVQLSLAGTLLVHSGTNSNWAEQGPLVPMEVIVWSGATAPPARAVLIEPKKNGNYQIFYTTPVLYNHKNPEINAQQVPGLASTARVSLPKLARFKFWTLNMLNHKLTKAVDVETSDVFLLNDKKNWPGSKRLHVVLKVD